MRKSINKRDPCAPPKLGPRACAISITKTLNGTPYKVEADSTAFPGDEPLSHL